MFGFVLAITGAVTLSQVGNIIAIGSSGSSLIMVAFKTALIVLPVTFLASACYFYFFSYGHKTLAISYPFLTLVVFSASLLIAMLVSYFALNHGLPSKAELIGGGLMVSGVLVSTLMR